MDKDVACVQTCMRVCTHTRSGMLFGHEKEGSPAFGNSMDGRGGHSAEWDKLRKTIRYKLTCVEIREPHSQEQRADRGCQGRA